METVWYNRRDCTSLCEECPGGNSPYPLGGLGDPDSDLMLVAQEPAYNVDHDTVELEMDWERAKRVLEENRRESMNPLWRQILLVAEAAGLEPTDLYFTNLAKCNDGESTWRARYEQCRGYFLRELEIVSPRAILLYGRDVIDAVFALYGLEVPSQIGEVHACPHDVPGRTVVPLYHWAYAMRSGQIESYNGEVTGVVRSIFSHR